MVFKQPWRGRGQAGEGKVALILGLLVLAGIIYFLKLAIPPRVQRAELADYVEGKTRAFVINQISQDQLVNSIVEETEKMGLKVTEDQIEVDASETRVRVRVTYDVTQKLIGGKEWVQHHEVERELPRF